MSGGNLCIYSDTENTATIALSGPTQDYENFTEFKNEKYIYRRTLSENGMYYGICQKVVNSKDDPWELYFSDIFFKGAWVVYSLPNENPLNEKVETLDDILLSVDYADNGI